MIEIRLFGPLCLSAGTAALGPRDLGGVKPKQVLEILLLARGRPVSKDALADQVWGEALPDNVSATLETYVSVLRRRLAALPGGAELVVTERAAYRVDRGRCRIDLDRFDTLEAQLSHVSPVESAGMSKEALALVEGDVLADEPYADWVVETRRHYQDRFVDLLLRTAEQGLAARDLSAALRHARRAVEASPVSESGWRAMMLALYAQSRRGAALQAFDRCRTILADELNVEPAAATVGLMAAIRRSEDPETLLPPPAPGAPGPGLKIAHGGGGSDGVALLGRGGILDQISGIVSHALDGTFTLILVEGGPGLGKTRLLDEAALRLRGGPRSLRVGRAAGHRLERRLPGMVVAAALREALQGVADTDGLLHAAAVRSGGRGWAALERVADVVLKAAPVVLVLDDLHHADPLSLGVLSYLSRRHPQARIAVLASTRHDQVTGDHPASFLEVDTRLRLDVIAPDDVPDPYRDLWAKTGGHPEFLAACLKAGTTGGAGWPRHVVDVVQTRCQRFGPRAHRLLVTGSAFGGPFSAPDLATVLDVPALTVVDELERLCEIGLLRPVGEAFDFRYEIVREVLAQSVSPARRQLLAQRLPTSQSAVRLLR